MIRFLTIPVEDICADPAAAGEVILHAIRRTDSLAFRSFVPLGDTLLICLGQRREDESIPSAFHFSQFRSLSADGAAAEIRARDQADQDLLCSFYIDETLWGLYADYRTGKEMV